MATGVPVWEIEPALGLLVGALMAGGIYPIVRRLGARADAAREASNSNTPPPAVPARKWGDSFQVPPPPPYTPLHPLYTFRQSPPFWVARWDVMSDRKGGGWRGCTSQFTTAW